MIHHIFDSNRLLFCLWVDYCDLFDFNEVVVLSIFWNFYDGSARANRHTSSKVSEKSKHLRARPIGNLISPFLREPNRIVKSFKQFVIMKCKLDGDRCKQILQKRLLLDHPVIFVTSERWFLDLFQAISSSSIVPREFLLMQISFILYQVWSCQSDYLPIWAFLVVKISKFPNFHSRCSVWNIYSFQIYCFRNPLLLCMSVIGFGLKAMNMQQF